MKSVYIVASRSRTLYVGVANDLWGGYQGANPTWKELSDEVVRG